MSETSETRTSKPGWPLLSTRPVNGVDVEFPATAVDSAVPFDVAGDSVEAADSVESEEGNRVLAVEFVSYPTPTALGEVPYRL